MVITTSNVDLYGTIVDSAGRFSMASNATPCCSGPTGWINPSGKPRSAKCKALPLSGSDRGRRAVFDSDPGRSIGERYARKECRGFSIGFVPVSYAIEAIDGVDVLRFTKWRLIELSATSIPANQDCLARAVDPSVDAYLGDCFERAAAASLPVDQYMVRSINEQLAGTGSVVKPWRIVPLAINRQARRQRNSEQQSRSRSRWTMSTRPQQARGRSGVGRRRWPDPRR